MRNTISKLARTLILGTLLLIVTAFAGATQAEAKPDRAAKFERKHERWHARHDNGRRDNGRRVRARVGRSDFDRDGIPNRRDPDDDGDGVWDWRDRNDFNARVGRRGTFRSRYSTRQDFDQDGLPNWRDTDDDNDG